VQARLLLRLVIYTFSNRLTALDIFEERREEWSVLDCLAVRFRKARCHLSVVEHMVVLYFHRTAHNNREQ
jgi:hypothetical protein